MAKGRRFHGRLEACGAGWLQTIAMLSLLAAPQTADAKQVTLRVVYDLSTNNYELGTQDYSGVSLSPDGKSLWIVNETAWAAISLSGQVRLHGLMPSQSGVSLGSLTFDNAGNAWGVSDGGAFTIDGSIFKISPRGVFKTVGYLTDTVGHPQSGLAYYRGALYGQSWIYGNGPANLYKISTSSARITTVEAANETGLDHGKPLITTKGVIYGPSGVFTRNSNGISGAYTLLKYDIASGVSRLFGYFSTLVSPYSLDIYGAGTPAIDAAGNVYLAVDRSQTVVPYSDVLLSVSPSGVATRIHYFPNLNNDRNTFSGLVFDSVHQRLYGGYFEINGYDYAKSNPGTIFCYNPATGNFASIFKFNGYNGSLPVGDFALDITGTKLYGATSGGGKTFDGRVLNSGGGEIFELSLGSTPPC